MSNLINKEDISKNIDVKRLIFNPETNSYAEMPHASKKRLFVKGPIYLDWLSAVAKLPGKCINVAMAIQWLNGMSGGKPIKLTSNILQSLNVSNDTTGDCLKRMEQAGLIEVTRLPGNRPTIRVVDLVRVDHQTKDTRKKIDPDLIN